MGSQGCRARKVSCDDYHVEDVYCAVVVEVCVGVPSFVPLVLPEVVCQLDRIVDVNLSVAAYVVWDSHFYGSSG